MDVPGLLAQLTEAVAELAAVSVDALEVEELKAVAVGAESVAQRLRSVGSRALGQLDNVAHTDRERAETAWWYRDSLGITGEAAGVALRRARGLRSLPQVIEAAVDGTLSLEQAGALVPLVGKLNPELLDALEPELIAEAAPRSVEGVGQLVRSVIASCSEVALEEEQALARDRRYLKMRLTADGMVRGSFALAAEDAEAVLTGVEAKATSQGVDDDRSAGQRRADALVEVFEAAAKWDDLPVAGGQRAQVSYVIGGGWAGHGAVVPGTHASREADSSTEGESPAEHVLRGTCLTCGSGAFVMPAPPTGAWTGPQTTARMERLLCDARISRILLNPQGQVLSLESLSGDITLAQRRAISARDRQCTARGCTRPPAYCEVHHLRHRKDGGATSVGNMVLLCTRHHTLWHLGVISFDDLNIPWWRPEMSSPPAPEAQAPPDGGDHRGEPPPHRRLSSGLAAVCRGLAAVAVAVAVAVAFPADLLPLPRPCCRCYGLAAALLRSLVQATSSCGSPEQRRRAPATQRRAGSAGQGSLSKASCDEVDETLLGIRRGAGMCLAGRGLDAGPVS